MMSKDKIIYWFLFISMECILGRIFPCDYFVLAQPNKFDTTSIIIVGDPQRTGFWERMAFREQNDSARAVIFRKIASEQPAAVFVLGDLVASGNDTSEWNYFMNLVSPLRQEQIPIYPLPGNHEYFGNNETALQNYFSYFPSLQQKLWYDVQWKSVAFILLNSNFDDMSEDQKQAQMSWYERTMDAYQQDDSIMHIIVLCHHSPYTNSTIVSESNEVQKYFIPKYLGTRKACLFISGHSHAYEMFSENGKRFIVTGGGGGPRQRLRMDTVHQQHRDQFSGGPIRNFHYCTLTIDGTALRFRMIQVDNALKDWSIGDEFIIDGKDH
jgi:hypothetical protein